MSVFHFKTVCNDKLQKTVNDDQVQVRDARSSSNRQWTVWFCEQGGTLVSGTSTRAWVQSSRIRPRFSCAVLLPSTTIVLRQRSTYTASGPAAQRSTALIAIWRLRHDGCSSRSIANGCRIVYKRSHCSANNGWYWARRGPFLTLIRVAKRRGGDLPGRARALFLPCPCVVSTSSWVCHTNVVGAHGSSTTNLATGRVISAVKVQIRATRLTPS
ncbi:hypothetical protein T06_10459 [Trichinella sp. T6]|nr:hypothetical protein T06_10459 [Trichinella sp. T6]